MASGRSLEKDYESQNSPDTESLLHEESQEKLLPTSLLPASKRKHMRTLYLHVAAIIFYGVITTLLYAWSLRLAAIKCGCEDAMIYCEKQTIKDIDHGDDDDANGMIAPARDAVEYERHTVVHKVSEDSKYRGPPRPEQDEAWDELLNYNMIRLQRDEMEQANLTSVPLNDEEGGYLASLDVFHTLHCVNKVRKSYYSDYYHDPNPIPNQKEHFDHCIDLLRQTIMCHGDIALHTYEWKDGYPAPWPSTRTEHQCRNWDKLNSWSRDRSIGNLTGPILMHPELGISYKGDEPKLEVGFHHHDD